MRNLRMKRMGQGLRNPGGGGDPASYSDTEQIAITPTYSAELLADPGLEIWASDTNLTHWSESINASSTLTKEATITHGGDFAAKFSIDALNANVYLRTDPVNVFTPGAWYKMVLWGRSESGAPSILFGPKSAPSEAPWIRTLSTDYAQFVLIRRQGTDQAILIGRSSAAGLTFYLDDISYKSLDLASCIGAKKLNSPNKAVSVDVTVTTPDTTSTPGGVCRVDSDTNPQNGLYAYTSGGFIVLDKQVNGVWTNLLLIGGNLYGDGKKIELRCNGTSVELWYDNLQRGATQTVADATIINNVYFGRFGTDAGVRLDNLSAIPYPFELTYTPLVSGSQRVVWVSDVHRSYDSYYDNWTDVARWINVIDPVAVIDTGDLTSYSLTAEFADYNAGVAIATADWYMVPGGHDEGEGLDPTGDTPDEVASFDSYDAAGLDRHFSFSVGNWQFIGFWETIRRAPLPDRNCEIDAGEKTWLLGEIAAAIGEGRTPIVCVHNEPAGNWSSFYPDLAAAGVTTVLLGHQHDPCVAAVSSGVTYINGDSVGAGAAGDNIGGMMILHVESDKITIEYLQARRPHTRYTAETTPAYTPIEIVR